LPSRRFNLTADSGSQRNLTQLAGSRALGWGTRFVWKPAGRGTAGDDLAYYLMRSSREAQRRRTEERHTRGDDEPRLRTSGGDDRRLPAPREPHPGRQSTSRSDAGMVCSTGCGARSQGTCTASFFFYIATTRAIVGEERRQDFIVFRAPVCRLSHRWPLQSCVGSFENYQGQKCSQRSRRCMRRRNLGPSARTAMQEGGRGRDDQGRDFCPATFFGNFMAR